MSPAHSATSGLTLIYCQPIMPYNKWEKQRNRPSAVDGRRLHGLSFRHFLLAEALLPALSLHPPPPTPPHPTSPTSLSPPLCSVCSHCLVQRPFLHDTVTSLWDHCDDELPQRVPCTKFRMVQFAPSAFKLARVLQRSPLPTAVVSRLWWCSHCLAFPPPSSRSLPV